MDFRKSVDEPKLSMAPCFPAWPARFPLRRNRNEIVASDDSRALLRRVVSGALSGRASAQNAPTALTKVVFSLDFIPLGRHAPWYAALAEGYYKDEGLDVSIIPAQGTAQVIQAVELGTAQYWFRRRPERRHRPRQRLQAQDGRGELREGALCGLQPEPTAPMSRSPSSWRASISAAARAASRPKIIQGFMAPERALIRASSPSAMSRRRRARRR